MQRSIGSIEDAGFDALYKPSGSTTTVDGDPKPETRTEEPERTTSRIAGFDTVSPFDIDGGPGDGTSHGIGSGQSGRRRGRPPGSKNRTSAEKAIQNHLVSLESLLMSAHYMASKWFDAHELELEATEAQRYAEALKQLATFYPVAIDPKKLAWIQLAFVMGEIYGSRGVAIYKRLNSGPKREPARVQPIRENTPVNGVPAPQTKIEYPSQLWNEDPIDEPL